MSNRNMDVLGRIIQKADPKLYDTLFYSDDGLELLRIVRKKNANNEVEFAIEIDDVINPYAKSAEVTEEINQKIAALGTVFSFKGVVETLSDLPQDNNEPGYVYHVKELESEYVWIDDDSTEKWEELGPVKVAQADYALVAREAIEADQLASDRQIENADEACPPITFGAIGGTAEVQDGYSKFEELRGNTICWNQLFVPRSTVTTSGVTVTNNGDGSFTLSDTATGEVYLNLTDSQYPISYIEGHKYLLRGGITTDAELSASSSSITGSWAGNTPIIFTANSGTDSGYVRVKIVNGTTYNNVKIIPQLFDLTKMFGAGNEPTTVEEFTSQFFAPNYAYNAGQLLSSKSASMILRGRNQWDEEWEVGEYDSNGEKIDSSTQIRSKNKIKVIPNTYYTLTTTFELSGASYYGRVYFYDSRGNFISPREFWGTDYHQQILAPQNAYYMAFDVRSEYGATYNDNICVYICYDTPNLPYVSCEQQVVTLPNLELKSAGSAYDVAYQAGGGKRRIGPVDLGTLVWSNNGNGQFMTTAYEGSSEIVRPSSSNIAGNILCARYENVAWNSHNGLDKTISLTAGGYIYIQDSAYSSSTATEFINSLQGVYLYCELGTEIDITIEENPGWTELVKIDNFGTIEFTVDPAQTPQVPQAYFIRYTVNLGEWVDTAYVKTNGDANKIITDTDWATNNKAGVVKIGEGLTFSSGTGTIYTHREQLGGIKTAVNLYRPIVSGTQHQSTFYGLAKAAGANLASSTSETAPDGTNAGVYPADAIQAILNMILPSGPMTDGTYDLVRTVSSGTITFSWVART